jgi:methyl-accepting chemotaxis protein
VKPIKDSIHPWSDKQKQVGADVLRHVEKNLRNVLLDAYRAVMPDMRELPEELYQRELRKLRSISCGNFSDEYFSEQAVIAANIAKTADYATYLAGYANYAGGLLVSLVDEIRWKGAAKRHETIQTLMQAIFSDVAVAMFHFFAHDADELKRAQESFNAERAKAAEEQAEAVRRLGAGLEDVAGGDLTVRLADGFTPDTAKIRDDFNAAVDRLKATMVSVVDSTGAIEASAKDVTAAADDLSRRTEQQAASLEETTATLTEVTAAVKTSAEGTQHAREVAAAADDDAKKSAAVVRQAVDAMGAIAKSSQQIGQIIGVIDEIAFQTNLLALNAGVEAARAGEAGRGFAVVASEVRALAQRSAQAAKEIKGLISDSSAQVDGGVKLVAETGRSLDRIATQVAEINAAVSDIASSAHEQATALQQINAAVEQMNLVTQQNAAMVEESTAAGHSLSEETARLAQLVGQFRVAGASPGETLRAELAKAAPHAFRAGAGAPAGRSAAAAARRAG